MEKCKRICRSILVPPMAVLLILLPISVAALVYSLICLQAGAPLSIAAYILSAYTLAVWCVRIPRILFWFHRFRQKNTLISRWDSDVRFRFKMTLSAGFVWNGAYAVFQLCLGIWHSSFWYCSMAVYYFFLAVMRLFLAMYVRRYGPGEDLCRELKRYRVCGWLFLFMNLALTLMIFFMVYWNRTFYHHEVTTIALAAFTFTSFTMAILNLIRQRRYQSPVYSAARTISFAAACVSMLTLESTMLTTFGGQGMDLVTRRLFLGLTGGAVSVLIIIMAVCMIARAGKTLKSIGQGEKNDG